MTSNTKTQQNNKENLQVNAHKRFSFEIKAGLAIAVVTALWISMITDDPLKIPLAILFGLTTGLTYYFVTIEKETTYSIRIFALSKGITLFALFLILSLALFIPPINDIFIENWLTIPATNWIRFIVMAVFSTFISGFIIIKFIDKGNRLPSLATIVLSTLLSMFFTSIFWYIITIASLPDNLVNLLFITSQLSLVLLYIQHTKKKAKTSKTDSPRTLNLNLTFALGTLVLLSAALVFFQQFIYNPFIRGDNWSYLSKSNYIDKGIFALKPVGKFYRLDPPFFYELFNLALFRLSGFPAINSMMITSIIVASLIPIAFYIMSIQYTKDNKISILSTLTYIAISGFGWIPFIIQKVDVSIKHYSPQDLLMTFNSIAPKVLNDIIQPQGSVPEGFKTYVLATVAMIMLLYLVESELPSKARTLLIAFMIAFAFQVHIEEALIWTLTFLPAYVLLSRKEVAEIRRDIAAVTMGFFATFMIGLTYPTDWIGSFKLNYILVVLALSSVFGYTFVKGSVNIRVSIRRLGFLRTTVLCLVCYFYLLSIIVLVFYGYQNMYYGDWIVYQGFIFPWYYYPLTFGVVGVFILIGLSMNFQKERTVSFFLLTIILLLVYGKLASFVNVNFLFTGVKEWRIIYRIIPIPASLFAGWTIYKLMRFLENATIRLQFKESKYKDFQLQLRSASVFLLILIIMLGIPSTILASEYWMITDATPFGRVQFTNEDLEAMNYIYREISMTSRIATISSRSNAILRLAGATTAIPSIYPDLLSAARPETAALLSSDVRYIYLDKETDAKYVRNSLVDYLPLVFNNSRVAIYELPYLEPPTDSNIGYIAPLVYTNRTLISYTFMASLNSSYQVVYDDIYDKSVLFLPSDLTRTEKYVLGLNGVNNYVDLGDIIDVGSGDLTVEAWFKTSASGKMMSLVNNRRSGVTETGYRVLIRGDTNRIVAELNDGTGTLAASGKVYNDGKWHHFVAVYDRDDTLNLYVDGLLEAQTDISSKQGSIDTDCPLTFGSQKGTDMFFEGQLSSVRIYHRALSGGEVSWNYVNLGDPVEDNLILWVPLDEGTGSVAHDLSNYGHDGVIHGADWSFEQELLSSVYQVEASKILDYVKDGGALVVLGGADLIYRLFEFQLGDYVEANEISVGDIVYSLDESLTFRALVTEGEGVKILSNYSLNNLDTSPFALQKSFGKGKLIYFYIDPINRIVNSLRRERFEASHIAPIINDSLKNANLYLSPSSASSARFPLEKRWMGRYSAYGENDFVAEGNITISSTLSGSYLLQNPLTADVVLINSIQTIKALQNVTINRINIIGEAELEIHSSICEIANKQTFTIPSYLPLQFENCTLKIRPITDSKLEIQTDEESLSVDDGEIILKLSSASFLIKKPQIKVIGFINFSMVSLPFIQEVWIRNAKLIGNVTFCIDYNDETYFFSDGIIGTYNTDVPLQYPKIEDNIPWKDIIMSPYHILTVILIINFVFYKSKRAKYIQIK